MGEFVIFMVWSALPLVAYVGAQIVLATTEHRRAPYRAPDAQERLEQLRRSRDGGRVVRGGRMADAVRLAQEAEASPAQRVRQT